MPANNAEAVEDEDCSYYPLALTWLAAHAKPATALRHE
jgi:hypothetical protein